METLRFLLTTTFYPPHSIGGDAAHVQMLAELLAKRGHEVAVVYNLDAATWKRVALESESDRDAIQVFGVRSRFPRLHVATIHLTGRSHIVERAVTNRIQEFRADVVHHHNISLLGAYPNSDRATSLYTAHDYWSICQRNDFMKYGRTVCVSPECLRCCLVSRRPPQLWRERDGSVGDRFRPGRVLAPSRYMAAQLRDRFLDYPGPVIHCPNFAPDCGRAEGQRHDYLLYVGVLAPHKGVRRLVEAAVREPSVRLHVVGSGGELEQIQRIVLESGAQDRIVIHGKVPRETLEVLYRGARALIVPSVWPENAPLVVLEAMSHGTPVIAARVGGLPELLDPIDPRLCRPAHELLGGLSSLEWLDGLRSEFRRRWERFYSPSAFMSRYFDILGGRAG